MIERNVLSIGAGIKLPFALIIERYTEYETVQSTLDEVRAAEMATQAADRLLLSQITGNRITNRAVKIELSEGVLYATVTGESTEQIAQERGFQATGE